MLKKHSNKDCNRCSLLAKQTFFDLVGERASSLIIKFEQVKKPFLLRNIYFTFLISAVNCIFYKSTIKSSCILLSCHAHVRNSREEVLCKKDNIRSSAEPATLLKKRFWHSCFPVNFAKFPRKLFLTEHFR